MSIRVEARFNSGNGGVSIVVVRERGGEIHETGEFLDPRKAVTLALEILHKVMDLPPEIDSKIRELAPGGRLIVPIPLDTD